MTQQFTVTESEQSHQIRLEASQEVPCLPRRGKEKRKEARQRLLDIEQKLR